MCHWLCMASGHICAPALERKQPSSAGGLGGDSGSARARALPVPCALLCPSSAGSAGSALSPEE